MKLRVWYIPEKALVVYDAYELLHDPTTQK